jgi:hypothetical protein
MTSEVLSTETKFTPELETELLPGGYTLSEWIGNARRDDCLERMVPSDLRQLLGIIKRERSRALDFIEALARLSNEAMGCEAFEPELRRVMGNTNYTLLIQRAKEARELLSEARGGSSNEGE